MYVSSRYTTKNDHLSVVRTALSHQGMKLSHSVLEAVYILRMTEDIVYRRIDIEKIWIPGFYTVLK